MIHYLVSVLLFSEDEGSGSGSGDGGDEDRDYCADGSYLCSKAMKCMPEVTLCDGINDCGDWEDESASLCGSK